MMGVTGAQRASAEARTTMDIKPRLDEWSKSREREKNVLFRSVDFHWQTTNGGTTSSNKFLLELDLLGQLGFLTKGLMMGMVLFETRDPVSERSVERETMAPTERRLLPENK